MPTPDKWLGDTIKTVKHNDRQVRVAERIVKRDRDLNQGAVMSVEEAHAVTKSQNQFIAPNAPSSMKDIGLPKAQYVGAEIGMLAVDKPSEPHHYARMRVGYGDRDMDMHVGYSGSGAIKIKNATLGR